MAIELEAVLLFLLFIHDNIKSSSHFTLNAIAGAAAVFFSKDENEIYVRRLCEEQNRNGITSGSSKQ